MNRDELIEAVAQAIYASEPVDDDLLPRDYGSSDLEHRHAAVAVDTLGPLIRAAIETERPRQTWEQGRLRMHMGCSPGACMLAAAGLDGSDCPATTGVWE